MSEQYEGVNFINYKNETYERDGYSLEDVFRLLQIDPTQTQLSVDGDTLYVLEKTGSKGASRRVIWEDGQLKFVDENPKSLRELDQERWESEEYEDDEFPKVFELGEYVITIDKV